jgi:RimJ/RimL family protein N-acetyltransferase
MMRADLTLIELTDEDCASMLGAAGVRPGLVQPPGGVDEPAVLVHVRRMAGRLHAANERGHWMFVVDGEVVGLGGIKAPPSRNGEVEIGYGVAVSRRRRGYATAAIGLMIAALRRDERVSAVVAMTALENVASQRVLAANGFTRTGTQIDPDDGETVIRWVLPVREAVGVERA